MKESLNVSGGDNSRRKFIKNLGILGALAITAPKEIFSQNTIEQIPKTALRQTSEKFKNGEYVYDFVKENGERVGEFWPIKGLNLITKQTDPQAFEGTIEEIQEKLGDKNIVATAPDGMTGGSLGSYKMEGKSLSNGRECGDGEIKNYGIVIVKNGFDITFTHKQEHLNDFDQLYNEVKSDQGTLLFLPSIYRNGKFLASNAKIDKALVRREVPKTSSTPKGEQLGIILFDSLITYDEAREKILGLNRDGKSFTTHIYMLDGGSNWGQSAKEVNGQVVTKGTRDPSVVTNYLVFY
jgi:hypothetical protein